MAFLEWTYYGNSLRVWITALLVTGALFAILEIVKGLLARRLSSLAARTAGEIDDLVSAVVGETRAAWLALVAAYLASRLLFLPAEVDARVRAVAVLAFAAQAALWAVTALDFLLRRVVDRQLASDPSAATTMRFLGFIGRVGIWAVFALLALSNLGVQVTALLTGLGVGGIAVALAVQNVLGDLFASLSIVLDKPFVIGDFVIVGDLMGTVEHVGLKTTRVRSLSGEQIIFSNADLLQSRIRNYKRMYERRVVFGLGVTYGTAYEKLARIPAIVREIVEAHEKTRFDRAHFHRYGASSLDIEVAYHVLDPDYNVYMDIQQAINLELFRRFAEEGIEFAYPTQTVYVNRVAADAALPAGGAS